ncbi:MAG: AraC family transcriptional regulator [Oscillospiraceae bacterium]|nr:AraC family transcriptional regulator [Oscillospiraceae bacterium]
MSYGTQLRESLDFIEAHLDEKITLELLAQKAHLSKYHYHRLFHKTAGEPLTKYIHKRRMEKAAGELVNTEQPIIEIALKYQYGSQEAFSRAFTRIYTLTPGKYRKINKPAGKIISFCAYNNQAARTAA